MKEMIYMSSRHDPEILDSGKFKDVKYTILNLGTHPTAYVENIVNAGDCNDEKLYDIKVHGGFTYLGYDYWNQNATYDTEYLGWDYAHLSDYVGWRNSPISGENKMWMTEEILEEVHFVIDQLIELKNKKS